MHTQDYKIAHCSVVVILQGLAQSQVGTVQTIIKQLKWFFLLQPGTTEQRTGHTEQQKWQIRIEFNHAMLNFKE